MEVKAGYKQTDVGVIPAEWDAGSLNKFWAVIDCKHLTAEFVENGIPVASIGEVQNRFVDLTNANQTTEQFYYQLIEGGRKPQPGNLILSRNATVGEVAQITERHPPFAMGQDVCLLRKRSSEYSTDYLQAVFQSPIIARQLENLMVGSTFKRINIEQIRSFEIPFPKSPEQRVIATALSDVDVLISSLNIMIAKKRDLIQAAMQELLTGKRRLQGFSGAWQKRNLGKLLKLRYGKGQQGIFKKDGLYPILATSGEVGRTNAVIYEKPSVLIGRKGTIDSPLYIDTPFWAIDTIFYSEINDFCDPKFIFYRFCIIDWLCYNEASGVPSLNAKTIENIEILYPKRDEQRAIATLLSDMDAELAALEQERDKIRAIKQGMMQELLTGRIRLT
jgi:type I restriction enzyme S subunit